MGSGDSAEENRPGCKADHSPPFSSEVKNEWSHASIPSYAFMAITETTPLKKTHALCVLNTSSINIKSADTYTTKYCAVEDVLTLHLNSSQRSKYRTTSDCSN